MIVSASLLLSLADIGCKAALSDIKMEKNILV
jgi:hypothetical protein